MANIPENTTNPILRPVTRLETTTKVFGGEYIPDDEQQRGISNLQAIELAERDQYILSRVGQPYVPASGDIPAKAGIAGLDTAGKVPKTQLPSDTVYTDASQTLKNKTIDAKDNTILNTPTWYGDDKTLNSSDLVKEITIGLNPSTDKVLTIDSSAQAPYLNYKLPIISSTDHSFVRFNGVWNKDVILFLQGGQPIDLIYVYNHQWVINEGVSFYLSAAKSIDGVKVNDWRKITCKGTTSYFYSYTGAASDYDLPSDKCCVEVTWNRESPNAAIAKAVKWEAGVKTVWIKSMQSGGWDSSWTEITTNNGTQTLTNKTIDANSNTLKNVVTSKNITNCITEIPQDLNVTVYENSIRVAAGSTIYYPDGFEQDGTTKKFSSKTLPTLRGTGTLSGTHKYLLSYELSGDGVFVRDIANCNSGTTTPTTGWGLYYNTSDNILYNIDNGTARQATFPIALINVDNGVVTIDQVFNGVGFIGKKVFALPGVKVLIPDGRNADGTLKNIAYTTNTVTVNTADDSWRNGVYILNTGIDRGYTPSYSYDEATNYWYLTSNGTVRYMAYVGSVVVNSSGNITGMNTKTAFHAVDWSDWANHIGSGTVHDVTSSMTSNFETLGGSGQGIFWCVINRVCYVTVNAVRNIATTSVTSTVVSGMPKAKMQSTSAWSNGTTNYSLMFMSENGTELKMGANSTANSNCFNTFSYPVADDWVES